VGVRHQKKGDRHGRKNQTEGGEMGDEVPLRGLKREGQKQQSCSEVDTKGGIIVIHDESGQKLK